MALPRCVNPPPPFSVEVQDKCVKFGVCNTPQNSETLVVEAAYYGHLNLVEYFVEKSGAEPFKVTLNLEKVDGTGDQLRFLPSIQNHGKVIEMGSIINSQFFMNHFNSKEQGEMSSNKKHPQTSTKSQNLPFLPAAACLIQRSQFCLVWNSPFNVWLNMKKLVQSQGSTHQCHRQIWSDTSLSSRVRSQDLKSRSFWNGLHRLIICDWC